MDSEVYFISVDDSESTPEVTVKFSKLIAKCGLLKNLKFGEKSVIKIHFGEQGNTGFVKPELVRVLHDKLVESGAESIVSDTNTLYRGRRTHSSDHTELAYEHGFTPEIVGARVFIPDDENKADLIDIPINCNHIKTAHLGKLYVDADMLISVAHFKGHMMTGFGGALKNVAMGCASRAGKLAQHCDVAPVIASDNCVGCGACVECCPVNAIKLKNGKAVLDDSICIGCASCIGECNYNAVDIAWEAGEGNIQKKIVEYAKAILDARDGQSVFFNFATKITQNCDCMAKDDPKIVPDLGIFASNDPVAIDKACYDMINFRAKKNVFKQYHPSRDPEIQLNYSAELGLGSLDYTIISL